jgi:hypothetical protein
VSGVKSSFEHASLIDLEKRLFIRNSPVPNGKNNKNNPARIESKPEDATAIEHESFRSAQQPQPNLSIRENFLFNL